MKGNKLIKVSTLGIFMIENYFSTLLGSSQVLGTEYVFNICNKRLHKGEVDLQVGNEVRAVALVM